MKRCAEKSNTGKSFVNSDIHTSGGSHTDGRRIPNSILLDLVEHGSYEDENSVKAESCRPAELEDAVKSRLPQYRGRFQAQIPAAEKEADRLSSAIQVSTPAGVKSAMGIRLGADFSNVRFHIDHASAARTDAMGARAYTAGNDIYFGKLGFEPSVAAHELVHTVQQGAVSSAGGVSESAPPGGVQMRPLFGRKKTGPAAAPLAAAEPKQKGRSEDFGLAGLFQEEPEASKGGWMHSLKEAAAGGASRVGGFFHSAGRSIADSAGNISSSIKRKNDQAVDAFNNFRSDYAHMSWKDRFLWSVKNPIARLTAEHRKKGTEQRNIENARIESLADQYRKNHLKSVMAVTNSGTGGTAAKGTGRNHLLKNLSTAGNVAQTFAQHMDSAGGRSLAGMLPGLNLAEWAKTAMEGTRTVSAAMRKHQMESYARKYEERAKNGEKLSKNDLRMLRIAQQGTGAAKADLVEHAAAIAGSGLTTLGKAAAASGVGAGVGVFAKLFGKIISGSGGKYAAAKRKENRRQTVERELEFDKRMERLRRAHPELTKRQAKHVVLKAFNFSSGKMKEAADFFVAGNASYLIQQAQTDNETAASMLPLLGKNPGQIAKSLGSTGRETYDEKNPFAKKKKSA